MDESNSLDQLVIRVRALEETLRVYFPEQFGYYLRVVQAGEAQLRAQGRKLQ